MRKRNIAEQQGIPEKERRNLEEIGIDEEKWYRLWYDLYHNSIASVNPAHPSIIKHIAIYRRNTLPNSQMRRM